MSSFFPDDSEDPYESDPYKQNPYKDNNGKNVIQKTPEKVEMFGRVESLDNMEKDRVKEKRDNPFRDKKEAPSIISNSSSRDPYEDNDNAPHTPHKPPTPTGSMSRTNSNRSSSVSISKEGLWAIAGSSSSENTESKVLVPASPESKAPVPAPPSVLKQGSGEKKNPRGGGGNANPFRKNG
jgi:hypothetical protein